MLFKKSRETRKEYLLRVAYKYLDKLAKLDPDALAMTVGYDDIDCDGNYLIDDIKIELDLKLK